MSWSDEARLSVTLLDISADRENEFHTLAREFETIVSAKGYGRAEVMRDEGMRLRYYAVRYWVDAAAAERCHADAEVRAVTSKMYQIARVSHVVNGARKPESVRVTLDERRTLIESDRRTGFERRVKDVGRVGGDRRGGRDRRLGPRRMKEQNGPIDLISAARRARENADAAFSKFKVGAALETVDGAVVTGCNIENATYGLTICAERVAMFKALSDGHRAFTRIVIVADTESPTPPCGACRQILWEFAGNLEITLADLQGEKGTHRLQDLLPLPFDARLL